MASTHNSNFLALWLRAKQIVRWPLQFCLTRNDDATHSFDVSIIAHLIGVIDRDIFGQDTNPETLAVLAIHHESGEVAGMGDVNSVAKNMDSEAYQAFKKLERIFENSMLDGLPEELRGAYRPLIIQEKESRNGRLVKCSDDISALLESEKELALGNFEYADAVESCRIKLNYWCKEYECVQWFCDHFMSRINETIDKTISKKM